jgi:hypothetical protein
VLDLEYQSKPYVYAGGAAVTRNPDGSLHVQELPDEASLAEFALSPSRRLVYSHWGARADHPVLLHVLGARGLGGVGGLYVGGGLIRFFFKKTEYRDSIRLLPRGVDAVAEAVGMQKAPLPYDDIFSTSLQVRIDAATNHAEIVLVALELFAERFKVETHKLPLTTGMAAVQDVENHLGRRFPHLGGLARKLCRMGSYGGRTEIFRRGLFRLVYLYDISSSYPARLEWLVPVAGPRWRGDVDRADVVSAVVTVPETNIPVLPLRHDQTLFFPTGMFEGVWPGDELRYAVSQGAVIEKVKTTLRFAKTVDLGDWVRGHYAARKSDPFNELYSKLLMNAFVGKTAQNRSSNVISYGPGKKRAEDLGSGYHRSQLRRRVPRFQNYAFYAVTLGRARVGLHELLARAHEPILCDTDSAATGRTLEETAGLGGVHLEGYGTVMSVAPKVYTKNFGKGLEFKIKGAARSHPRMTEKERKAAEVHLRDLLAGKQVSLRHVPTQLQLWDKGELELEDLRDYRLKLERVKRKFDDEGNSRPWTASEVYAGEYEKPLEDRGIFAAMMEAMR